MRLLGILVTVWIGIAGPAFSEGIFAKRTLRVGTILTAGDLQVRNGGDPIVLDQMLGQEVRHAVYAGHRITAAHIGPPTLVHRNEVVAMTYRTGALGIRTEGRALTRGGAGEVVDVMNLASRQTVRAVVIGPRQVEVRR